MKIRELRFGKPKTGKTKNVVESYPTPMLVLNTEMDGLASVRKEIQFFDRSKLSDLLKIPALDGIHAVEYIYARGMKLSMTSAPTYNAEPMRNLCMDINQLTDCCPFKTVVLDSLTGLNEMAIGQVGASNPKIMDDARKWAGMAGARVMDVISVLFSLPIDNVVITGHERTRENEKSGEVATWPSMVSSLCEQVGGRASQFLYAETESNGKGGINYFIQRQPAGLIKGIGCRNDFQTAKCGPRYEDIYGKGN